MKTENSEDPSPHDFSKVRAAVSSLERAIRSHRVHEGRGPTLDEHIEAATGQLSSLLENHPLTLRVSSFGLLYGNRPLSGARGVDATWFGLFADSVRDLCFQPGLSSEEVRVFIEVLCSEPEEGDDRVTLLWRREVHSIELFLSSLVPTRLEPGADGDIRLVSEGASPFEEEPDSPGTSAMAFSQGDPRRMLGCDGLSWLTRVEAHPFEVDPWIEAAGEKGGARARGEDAGRLVDVLLAATGPENSGMPWLLETHLDQLLTRDSGGLLGSLLRALLDHESPSSRPILEQIAGPAFMTRLAPLCDVDAEGLEDVVSALGKVDPDGLSALLVELRDPGAQARYARLAGETGGDVLPFYLNQLDSEDEHEALSAVQALATIDGDRGLPGLAKAMGSSMDRVRYQALRALGGRYHPDLAVALVDILEDSRRVHRLLALRLLQKSGDPQTARSIVEIVKRPDFLDRDPEEKKTWLGTLASFPESDTFAAFEALLSMRSAIRKTVAELQLVAVEQLGRMKHPQARRLLVDSKGSWQLARSVRKAIAKALEEGGT
jgi:hypothetical protein